eukprot:8329645-Pyramimonas_sp.AAC.1
MKFQSAASAAITRATSAADYCTARRRNISEPLTSRMRSFSLVPEFRGVPPHGSGLGFREFWRAQEGITPREAFSEGEVFMYGSCAKHGHDVLNAAGFAVVFAHVSGRVGQMFLQTSGAAGHLAAVAANLLSINVE